MSRRLAALASIAIVPSIVAPFAIAAPTPTPEPRPSPVAIVVDTSGSMSESDGSSSGRVKIDGAKVALLDFLQQVEPGTQIGLRNYPAEGERTETEEGCSKGRAQFEVKARDPAAMAARIRTLGADGDTPTAAALKAAADELQKAGASEGTIVLVSDGESNCGRDPCEVAKEIAGSGIDLQTITVGFRVSGAGAKELQCIADQTGGKYLSVHDNEGLAEAFDEISRPKLRLEVSYPTRVTAQVGSDPSGLVRIEATITNAGQRLARGAVARIRFDVAAGAPAVIRPVVYLGNLDPGSSRKVAWVFRPGVPSSGGTYRVPFTVLGGAQNTLSDTEFEAAVEVRDAYYSADDAGPILGDRRQIAIVGDSYSAGEGADAYLSGTDTDANPCHRSRATYLVEAFGLADEDIVACSGAVANDIEYPQGDRTVDSQVRQLIRLRDDDAVQAVVMTLGGNDAGFKEIAMSCIIGRSDCSRTIYEDVPLWQRRGAPAEEFLAKSKASLEGQLPGAYRAVNRVVNGPAARAAVGPVPILVLAYPMPVPLTPRACREMGYQLSASETKFLGRLIIEVNGTIEGVVSGLRKKDGIPVFFVPNTEMAFQPDHTLCDRKPYGRTLASVNGAGFDGGGLIDAFRENVWKLPSRAVTPLGRFLKRLGLSQAGRHLAERTIQELVHPNVEGYAAMTRAVLRWSQSPAAAAALRFLESAPVVDPPPPVTIEVDGPEDLGQLVPGITPTLQGGASYPLNLDGLEPDSTVTIGAESEFRLLGSASADADGTLSTSVGVPADLEPGEHTLVVTGTGAGGEPRTVEIPFRIAGGGLPRGVTALIWGGVVGAVVSLLLTLTLLIATRRRDRRGQLR